MSDTKTALSFSLLHAASVVEQVLLGNSLPAALSDLFEKEKLSPQTMGAIQALAYHTMRQLGLSQALLQKLAKKTPKQPLLQALFFVTFAHLIKTNNQRAYEPFTLVNQSVSAAKNMPAIAHAKGMVNAVLRRFLREEQMLLDSLQKDITATWNYPTWWIKKVQNDYPKQWTEILAIGNQTPPLTLRVNTRKITPEAYLMRLKEKGILARQIGPTAMLLEKPVPVSHIIGFKEGLVSVQDFAAQKAVPLLDLKPGMRVLDACAAPGGKSAHILERCDVDLLALDVSEKRLQKVRDNLKRLQLTAHIQQGDAREQTWWDGVLFDRIVIDAPCTASGIVRRHPDIKWLRRPTDIQQLTTLSAQILDNLWQLLRPNGTLLFITCSIWPEESENQAQSFAIKNNAKRLPADGQLLPTNTKTTNHDGLFYALFQKE